MFLDSKFLSKGLEWEYSDGLNSEDYLGCTYCFLLRLAFILVMGVNAYGSTFLF